MGVSVCCFSIMLSLIKIAFAAVSLYQCAAGDIKNVFGHDLDTCSKPGTALTGFTRDGHCQDYGDDDAGSHHVCIEMKSDFCSVTGQPDWCNDKMECMGGGPDCKIGNWCVCQWAFARYIQMAGGCDAIVDLVCDATNMAAMKAYEKEAPKDGTIADALACLKKRCNVVAGATALTDVQQQPVIAVAQSSQYNISLAAGCVMIALVAAGVALRLRKQQQLLGYEVDDIE